MVVVAGACAPPEDFDYRRGASSSSTTGGASTTGTSTTGTSTSATATATASGTAAATSGSDGESSSSGGCTADEDCDDANECTDDACVDGVCENTDVADDTSCDTDDNSCTQDVCRSGVCEHLDEDDGTTCDDEPNADTEDKCCAGTCEHYETQALEVTYSTALMDPHYGDTDRNGVIDENDQCILGTMTATLSGPGEGEAADSATYTLNVTMNFNQDDFDPDAEVPEGRCVSTSSGYFAEQAATFTDGMEYDADTNTLTVEHEATSTCDGGELDFTLDYHGPAYHGTIFFLPASVEVTTDDCCYVESLTTELGDLIFQNPDQQDQPYE